MAKPVDVKPDANSEKPDLTIDELNAVTGGAVKLTDRMEERPHTKEQLVRLTKVKDWLRDEGIFYPDDLIELS